MSDFNSTKTWPKLAISLFDRLTERQAEIAYKFENLEIDIPGSTEPNAERAIWRFNGTISVTTCIGVTQ